MEVTLSPKKISLMEVKFLNQEPTFGQLMVTEVRLLHLSKAQPPM